MENKHNRLVINLVYVVISILLFASLYFLGHLKPFQDFFNKIEQSAFDIRQTIISKYKTPSKDMLIIAIDDATYEYVMDKYGSWPVSRQTWADTINYIEQAKPKNIVFDMLFLKPDLSNPEGDKALIDSVKKYNNIYLSMNFDNYNDRIRTSPDLDDKFKLKIIGDKPADNYYISFINARQVMSELSNVTDNIGGINVTRDNDGIIRYLTPIFKYKGDYYPNLSLKVALDLFDKNSFAIKNNKIIFDDNHFIPLDSTHRVVLNWYGGAHTYEHVALWEIMEAQKNNDKDYFKKFENKIIYVGATATGLSDIKSVPTATQIAGVELHMTFLNNLFDNNFIKKNDKTIDFIIAILLAFIVGFYALKTASVIKTIQFLAGSLILYFLVSIFVMAKWNLWISLTLPMAAIIIIFLLAYCEKYLLKSKDYEQTYKLAVTDGLTQLYNHRYFQEQMINNVNAYNRYATLFSLILIDIDFFKKFNDTYGHQSGDCVLKQVANILKKNSRVSDIVCRYGGEEMAIILTNTNKEEATIMANKICVAVRNNKFTLANNEKVNVTISLGVATVGENGEKPQEIIEYSDKCLYVAKESGRNQVVAKV